MIRTNRRGNIAVEVVLMLSVMAIIVSGTIDYGVYFHRQASLAQAAHAAARYASINPEDTNTAVMIGEDSYFNATGQYANFNITFDGVEPDLFVVVNSNTVFDSIVGMVTTPDEHNHTAYIRVSDQ